MIGRGLMGVTRRGVSHAAVRAWDNAESKVSDLLARRDRFCAPKRLRYYCWPDVGINDPLVWNTASMQYIFDEQGRKFLDCFAGISTISCGYNHPYVEARSDQYWREMGTVHTTTCHANRAEIDLATKCHQKLEEGLPDEEKGKSDWVSYFVNSGSEAIELATSVARVVTGNFHVVGVDQSYHGLMGKGTALSIANGWYNPNLAAVHTDGVHHIKNPHFYRSPYRAEGLTPEQIAEKSVEDLDQKVTAFKEKGEGLACFLAEPIQGVGGMRSGAPNFLPAAYATARKHGGLCISDEVQTGEARTGDAFWGYARAGIVPDMVVTAKGLGNGAAIGAVFFRKREYIDAVEEVALHFNTYGANPFSTSRALATIECIEKYDYQENARLRGAQLRKGLEEMKKGKHADIIGNIRGAGLMTGTELVQPGKGDPDGAPPPPADLLRAKRTVGLLKKEGILLGFSGAVLRFQPPLCITEENVDFFLDKLDKTLTDVKKWTPPQN